MLIKLFRLLGGAYSRGATKRCWALIRIVMVGFNFRTPWKIRISRVLIFAHPSCAKIVCLIFAPLFCAKITVTRNLGKVRYSNCNNVTLWRNTVCWEGLLILDNLAFYASLGHDLFSLGEFSSSGLSGKFRTKCYLTSGAPGNFVNFHH